MTADPRELIAEALAAHRADVQHGYTDPAHAADDVLGVLAAAGLAVVPVAETRTDHGVAYWVGGDDNRVAEYDDGMHAAVNLDLYPPGAALVSRTVHVGPWLPEVES